jgi:hypothetical protein
VAAQKGLLIPPPAILGLQTNLPVASLAADRWALCYQEGYEASGTPLATVLGQCSGQYLLLGCLPGGTSQLTVAAADLRANVTFDTGVSNTSFHPGNGVAWYYNDNMSWGFFNPADGIYKNACDTTSTPNNFPQHRLCWHTGSAGGAAFGQIGQGYLCGVNVNLFTSSWQRVIYRHL